MLYRFNTHQKKTKKKKKTISTHINNMHDPILLTHFYMLKHVNYNMYNFVLLKFCFILIAYHLKVIFLTMKFHTNVEIQSLRKIK